MGIGPPDISEIISQFLHDRFIAGGYEVIDDINVDKTNVDKDKAEKVNARNGEIELAPEPPPTGPIHIPSIIAQYMHDRFLAGGYVPKE